MKHQVKNSQKSAMSSVFHERYKYTLVHVCPLLNTARRDVNAAIDLAAVNARVHWAQIAGIVGVIQMAPRAPNNTLDLGTPITIAQFYSRNKRKRRWGRGVICTTIRNETQKNSDKKRATGEAKYGTVRATATKLSDICSSRSCSWGAQG